VTKCTARLCESFTIANMEPAEEYFSPLEAMARKLADMAGVEWDRLREYPGYERNHWRHEAEVMIKKMEWARLR
jgi:hypothetical protein